VGGGERGRGEGEGPEGQGGRGGGGLMGPLNILAVWRLTGLVPL